MFVWIWMTSWIALGQPVDLADPASLRTLDEPVVAAFIESKGVQAQLFIGDGEQTTQDWVGMNLRGSECERDLPDLPHEHVQGPWHRDNSPRRVRAKDWRTQRLDSDLFGVLDASGEMYAGPPDRLKSMHAEATHRYPWVGASDTHIYVLRREHDGTDVIERVPRDEPDLRTAEVVYTGHPTQPIERARRVGSTLVLVKRVDGHQEVTRVGLTTTPHEEPLGIVASMFVDMADPTTRPMVVKASGVGGETRWRIDEAGPAILEDQASCPFEFVTLHAASEGAEIPITLVQRIGQPSRAVQPLWVKVYGGYGIVEQVDLGAFERAWLHAGGRIAVAHVRGGGARGEPWHRQATGRDKSRGWEDLNAVVSHLQEQDYASPTTTFVWGASHGALLAVSAAARRPELYGAVVAGVGAYDFLTDHTMNPIRHTSGSIHRSPTHHGYRWPEAKYEQLFQQVGPGGGWGLHPANALAMAEFARPWGPDAAPQAAREASPVWIEPQGPLPPIFLYTGHRDIVVNPLHSVRLAAAWEDRSGGPVLLRVYGTWTHAHPPIGCGFGWAFGPYAMSSDAMAFVLNALQLLPRGHGTSETAQTSSPE